MAVAEAAGPGFAPAKVNLALHVTGRRDDGYHLLDSLVVFAGVGDVLTVIGADGLTLSVGGPFALGVPTDGRNLVLRAAVMLADRHGIAARGRIDLCKNLPHAAGIGGGSSDAAAALRLLSAHWGVECPGPDDPAVLALGADVPVCLAAPRPQRMRGIGERVDPLPALPPMALVLVNPRVEVPTAGVFARLDRRDNPPLPVPRGGMDYRGLVDWLRGTRNDLQAPVEALAPGVAEALALLRGQRQVDFAVMSGSGATCVGLTADIKAAGLAAAEISRRRPDWWVVAAPVLS
jgi:4-diphosphocytidyl-2-C-methyl-D-erythritol kinase